MLNCRGRAVTNVGRTCGPTPLHTCTCNVAIKYVYTTSNPTLIDSVSILPGLNDHDIVRVLVNAIPSHKNRSHLTSPFTKIRLGNKTMGISSLSSSLTLLRQMFKNCGINLLADLRKALINLSLQGKLALVVAFHG